MSKYKWWRKLVGGYWVYWHFVGWRQVTRERYDEMKKDRLSIPEWSFEHH